MRQLRLRDIGGMIVIDFIDMVLESNRDLVLRRLTEALARDRTRHQVSEVTSLGLVQLTRKRLGTGLIEGVLHQLPALRRPGHRVAPRIQSTPPRRLVAGSSRNRERGTAGRSAPRSPQEPRSPRRPPPQPPCTRRRLTTPTTTRCSRPWRPRTANPTTASTTRRPRSRRPRSRLHRSRRPRCPRWTADDFEGGEEAEDAVDQDVADVDLAEDDLAEDDLAEDGEEDPTRMSRKSISTKTTTL